MHKGHCQLKGIKKHGIEFVFKSYANSALMRAVNQSPMIFSNNFQPAIILLRYTKVTMKSASILRQELCLGMFKFSSYNI